MTHTGQIPTAPPSAIPHQLATPRRLPIAPLIAMMLLSFLLVTSEFLPNGVLTEMAHGLGVTTGQAGQTVTITGLAGLLVAPTIGLMVPRMDRRHLLAWTAILGAVSNIIVAVAPSFVLVLVARFLLGAAISAFWSMSITVAAHIAGPARLGRAVMFTTAGMSLATVAGVPLGVLIATALDWRMVFGISGVALALLAGAILLLLPSVPASGASSLGALWQVLRRPGIALGLTGHILVVLGHFVTYTYVRLALERVTEVSGEPLAASTIVFLLALFGAGGLIGNLVIGIVIDRALRVISLLIPLLIAASVLTVITAPGAFWAVAVAIAVWGFCFASWLIVVNTWIGQRVPDGLEQGGSLVVVGFQAGIVVAAGLGGVLSDALGITTVYAGGAVALILGAILFGVSHRAAR